MRRSVLLRLALTAVLVLALLLLAKTQMDFVYAAF
jgi:hypothetical protein